MSFITQNIRRLRFAFMGLAYAFVNDFSYRTQVWSVLLVLVVVYAVLQPLTQTEILFLGLSYTLILITELQNSSFEAALDHLHPELHDNIGRSKDMAAGAVLTAALFLVFVVVMIVLH
jgi:diacylglycerol kinase